MVRPFVLAITAALSVATYYLQPGKITDTDLAVVLIGFVAMVATWLLSYRTDPIRLALAAQPFDALLIVVVMFDGDTPEQAAQFLLMPIIGFAYFGSVRLTILGTVASALIVQVASWRLDSWSDDRFISPITFLIGICGALVAFITSRARRAEGMLELDVIRDRIALRLARGIRLADDPTEAIHEIARTIGSATGADQSVVVLLEHDDDYVADIATWQRRPDAPPLHLDVTSIDATLRHLVATGHGAQRDGSGTRLITPADSEEMLTPGNSSIDASMQALLDRVGATTGVIASLPMGGRAVGAIVLTSDSELDWDGTALPLLDTIAPQLAAGLAQVVLVRDQRDALDSLERVDQMRDRLIANVSHELRTPLTSTIGFIETLLRTDVTFEVEERRSMMEHARDGGLRLLALVEDLLALGSTRPESLDLAPAPVRLSELVQDAIRGLPEPADRRIVLLVDEDCQVLVDRNRMLQVFGNLVVNALHHGRGDVEVRCHACDSNAFVDVYDDGTGVADEHVNELFLPFARFSTRSDSTGLGLAICRSIIEAHGGAIDYERIECRTRFRIRIPTERPA